MDRRLTAANGRVADAALRGTVEAGRFVEGVLREVDQPVADLLAAPGGRRERQVVLGAGVKVYEARDGWAFVQAVADGYVGYLPEASLRGPVAATPRVTATGSNPSSASAANSPLWARVPADPRSSGSYASWMCMPMRSLTFAIQARTWSGR